MNTQRSFSWPAEITLPSLASPLSQNPVIFSLWISILLATCTPLAPPHHAGQQTQINFSKQRQWELLCLHVRKQAYRLGKLSEGLKTLVTRQILTLTLTVICKDPAENKVLAWSSWKAAEWNDWQCQSSGYWEGISYPYTSHLVLRCIFTYSSQILKQATVRSVFWRPSQSSIFLTGNLFLKKIKHPFIP